jgi:putative nucleotide binding protein
LEAIPKKGIEYLIGDKLYVGRDKDERIRVEHILGRINYNELTSSAKAELPSIIVKIVNKNENKFIDFFNNAPQVTPRMHSLELIPGIGKRIMFQIIRQRERTPFQSFEDLQNRVNITEPIKLLSQRILQEIQGEEKYSLFVRPK